MSHRTILSFGAAAILASGCLEALAGAQDKSQPPTSVRGKGPVASVELIRKTGLKDDSKASAPLQGPDWIETDQKPISSEWLIASPDNKFSLQLRESPDDEGDIAIYKVALTWRGEHKSVPLGLSMGAVISPDSRYIVLEPYWLIDVQEWKEYDLRNAFDSKQGYFGVDRWSKNQNKFVLHFVQCPFDCSSDESIEYWLVGLGQTAPPLVTYFPMRDTSANDGIEKVKSDWYSEQLDALQEPSLWEVSRTQKTESYRFLWLRTRDHPIAVRVNLNSDGTASVTAKMTSGAGGYYPGKLVENRTHTINSSETRRFLAQIEEHNFWKLASVATVPGGADGADWIVEGVKLGTYRVVERWSPQDGDVRAIALFMVNQLAKFELTAGEVY